MTSNQESVSCDLCKKNNFRGLRYKCLVCYDYDLCSICYEAGLTSSRHTISHPMQCIIAKNDYDLFYAGESISTDQPHSLTCPLCGSLGFTESTLLEHVTNEHGNSDNDEPSAGVVCPVCGVETNQLTYDFATHLTMEHRAPRDPTDQVAIRGRGGRCHVRSGGPRGRRAPALYTGTVCGGSRDGADPLTTILAQLSGARGAGAGSSHSSQLQQLQMHLQSSPSFSPRASNNQEVRITRRTFQSMNNHLSSSASSNIPSGGAYASANGNYCSQPFFLMDQSSTGGAAIVTSASGAGVGANLSQITTPCALSGSLVSENPNNSSQYLLPRCMKPILTESEQQQREVLKADRSLFVQELLLQIGLLH